MSVAESKSDLQFENDNIVKTRDYSKKSSVPDPEYDDEEEGNCGYGSCEPQCLQVFNNPKGFLVLHCFVLVVQGILVGGLFSVCITSLEQRFGFQSSETGTISICYDIGFCVVTPFVSYFAAKLHRPRFIGKAIILLGIGSLFFAVPHFTTPPYTYSADLNSTDDTCTDDEIDCQATNNESTGLRYYIWVFVLGQLLSGAGGACLFNLGLSFIEDTVPKNSASIYLGIANASTAVGPIIGYLLGGYFLKIYVDFDVVDTSKVEITPEDPRWVGAWWIGFIVCTICSFLVSIPILAFPKQIPGTARNRAMRDSEVPVDGGEEIAREKDFGKSLKDAPAALLILFKNSTYVFIVLSTISDNLIENGFATFYPKILEKEFHQTASYSSSVTGLIVFPATILGSFLGGVIINRFKWNIPSICKFCLVTFFFAMALRANIFFGCENRPLAGVTISYRDQDSYNGSLWAPCNFDCVCQQECYIPVCGADNINYFTACHAGCINAQEINGVTHFYNCSCIEVTNSEGWMAREGNCPTGCNTLTWYLIFLFLATFFHYLASTPTIVIMFRIVPSNLRPFSLGIRILCARALGAIPGPILYGAIFDLTCILWQNRQCDETRGSCWVYNNEQFSLYMFIIPAVGKVITAILFFFALWFYKPPPKNELETEHDKDDVNGTSLKTNNNSVTPSDQSLNNELSLDVVSCNTKLQSGAILTKL